MGGSIAPGLKTSLDALIDRIAQLPRIELHDPSSALSLIHIYTDNDKEKALSQAFKNIEKKYGKGAIMKMGEAPKVDVTVIPTGAINLDIALGVGGLPRGRVIEIFGPESSGKTTLTLHCIAEDQKLGNTCAFIDAEHAMDAEYAKKLGVNIDELILSQPDTGEQALDIAAVSYTHLNIIW